ncbi:MAG: PQQ-binding-like beta-propeller repeat protein, partial [Planctomycetota bacterium]
MNSYVKFWFVLAVIVVCGSLCFGADWPQFRGPDRDGRSDETGLLSRWPEGGPEMVWSIEGLGTGFASLAVVDGTIYTTGMIEGTGYLFAIGTDGKEKYKKAYGP